MRLVKTEVGGVVIKITGGCLGALAAPQVFWGWWLLLPVSVRRKDKVKKGATNPAEALIHRNRRGFGLDA